MQCGALPLSYGPMRLMVEPRGLEPLTSALSHRWRSRSAQPKAMALYRIDKEGQFPSPLRPIRYANAVVC